MQNDPAEKVNIIRDHSDVAAVFRQYYDVWWESIQPMLINERVIGPKSNPFKALYWKQFGGGPDAELKRVMDPKRNGIK